MITINNKKINNAAPNSSQKQELLTAIVIPGGGLEKNGDIYLQTKLRIEKAVKIFQSNTKCIGKKNSNSCIFITLSAGTTHKPNPLDSNGFPIYEAASAAKYLINKYDIHPKYIWEENFSLDTLGNAYFLRTMHTDPANIKDLIIITNNWHMDRVKAMFTNVFNLPYNNNNNKNGNDKSTYNLEFIITSSGLSDKNIEKQRINREISSLYKFNQETKNKYNDMKTLHTFIFNDHMAYSTSRQTIENLQKKETELKSEVLSTY